MLSYTNPNLVGTGTNVNELALLLPFFCQDEEVFIQRLTSPHTGPNKTSCPPDTILQGGTLAAS